MSNALDDMLDDAKILADYGWRSGQLKDARLFDAIAAFERLPARTWTATETVNLQGALNDAVAGLAPTTLSDIKLRNPFTESTRRQTLKRAALIGFSILLMVLTARFTILYNTGAELAASLNEINEARPAEKLAAVARQWRSLKAEDAANETYYRMLDELRELDSQVGSYTKGYNEFRQTMDWWSPATYLFPTRLPFASAPDGKSLPANYPAVISCGVAPEGGKGSENVFGTVPPGIFLKENKDLIANFACTELLQITPYSMPTLVAGGANIQDILKVLGFWLLPGFYGALGATISYMRAILNPVLPDPTMERIIHRIALGGFAGIIFAWFWAPSADASQQFVGLTINSFAVAFIIGFSIDVLFALLDTVVRFLQNVVNQIGQSGGGSVPAGAHGGASRPPAPLPPPAPPPLPPVIRDLTPSTLMRATAPFLLTLSGEGLAEVRDITLRNGAATLTATGVKATSKSIEFVIVMDDKQPVGDWAIELTGPAGARVAIPQLLKVA